MGEHDQRSAATDAALWIRYVIGTWRRVVLNHAFDEVDALARVEDALSAGLHTDLSALASRRLRAASSGVTTRAFAIRPWSAPETPQRGRDNEFWALSCRIFDDESVRADAEAVACAVEVLRALRLTPRHVKVRISHRDAVRSLLVRRGVAPENLDAWFPLLHRAGKISNDDFLSDATELGMEANVALDVLRVLAMSTPFENPTTQLFLSEQAGGRGPDYFKALFAELSALGVADWCVLNLGIVRAGAHHAGIVFEAHDATGRGRSIVGGGRSAFESGGTAWTAVGFDMGDSALIERLRDAGALPSIGELTGTLGTRTRAVVGAVDDPDALAAVVPLAAALRRADIRTAIVREPAADILEFRAAAGSAGHAVLIESGQPGAPVRVADVDSGTIELVPVERLAEVLRAR